MIPRDGTTFRGQRILSDGEALTRAIVEAEIEHVSANDSEAFAWFSSFATGTTDIEVLTIQNDHPTKQLVIERIWLAVADTAILTIGHVTSGVPAGTVATPTCLNRGAIKTAQATAFGNASVTGTVVVASIWEVPLVADAVPYILRTGGALLLGKDDIFGISCSASTTPRITVFGYFADPLEL